MKTANFFWLLACGVLCAETPSQPPREQPAPEQGKEQEASQKQESDSSSIPDSPEVIRLKQETARLEAEKAKLQAELGLSTALREKELAERKRILEEQKLSLEEKTTKLGLEEAERKLAVAAQVKGLQEDGEVAAMERALAEAKSEAILSQIKMREAESREKIFHLKSEQELQSASAEARLFTGSPPEYLDQPLQGNTLVISDRRIPLNDVITTETADMISSRIAYYNNKDPKKPIFIVIDDSPGGSVMAGYRILKAMEGSSAPVHVVVKSFAASMAAVITTLAKESYAYPNAVILHHQLSGGTYGNLTEQKEQLALTEEWWKRLAGPVSKKLGLTDEQLIKDMYQKSSTGDWEEFADNAQKLKWVDHIVEGVRETGQTVHPESSEKKPDSTESDPASKSHGLSAELSDDKGRRYRVLPRLNPRDVWWLYNADSYYRAP